MKQFSKILVLCFASIIFTLILIELIVRFFVPVRNVGPVFSEYDAVYGKRHKRNFSCERITPEFTMRFSTNSLGCRGPEPSRFPEAGILFLGDSYTEGYGANDGEEFPDRVRKELAKHAGNDTLPVVNCGMGDIGNGRWLKFLKREGKHFNPRLVVLQLTDNDFYDNVYERMFVLSENDSLLEYPPAQPGIWRSVQTVIEAVPGLSYSYLIGLLKQASWVSAKGHEPPPSDDVLRKTDRLTYRLIDQILTLCESEHWPMIIVTFDLEGTRRSNLQLLATQHLVQIIKTPNAVERPDLYYTIDGHANAKGHEFVANQVLDAIAVAGILQQ